MFVIVVVTVFIIISLNINASYVRCFCNFNIANFTENFYHSTQVPRKKKTFFTPASYSVSFIVYEVSLDFIEYFLSWDQFLPE